MNDHATTEHEIIASLERDYPGWQVWVVHRAVQGPVWCARRHSEGTAAVNVDSADQLRAYLDARKDADS